MLTGHRTAFPDLAPYDKVADNGNYPKRIYCVTVEMEPGDLRIRFECSVGLSIDGMPADFGNIQLNIFTYLLNY